MIQTLPRLHRLRPRRPRLAMLHEVGVRGTFQIGQVVFQGDITVGARVEVYRVVILGLLSHLRTIKFVPLLADSAFIITIMINYMQLTIPSHIIIVHVGFLEAAGLYAVLQLPKGREVHAGGFEVTPKAPAKPHKLIFGISRIVPLLRLLRPPLNTATVIVICDVNIPTARSLRRIPRAAKFK